MHKGKKYTLLPLTLAEIVKVEKERAANLNDTKSENQQVAKSAFPHKKDKPALACDLLFSPCTCLCSSISQARVSLLGEVNRATAWLVTRGFVVLRL